MNARGAPLLGIDLDTTPGAYDVSVRVDAPSGIHRGRRSLSCKNSTRRLTVDDERESATYVQSWIGVRPPSWHT
jgi:hypothetical protein